jgi:hypothetical protein
VEQVLELVPEPESEQVLGQERDVEPEPEQVLEQEQAQLVLSLAAHQLEKLVA